MQYNIQYETFFNPESAMPAIKLEKETITAACLDYFLK